MGEAGVQNSAQQGEHNIHRASKKGIETPGLKGEQDIEHRFACQRSYLARCLDPTDFTSGRVSASRYPEVLLLIPPLVQIVDRDHKRTRI
jgi:hypothetical protein